MYRNIIACCLKKKGETNPHCIQPHDIHFQLLQHIPESLLRTLVVLMNVIWDTWDLLVFGN